MRASWLLVALPLVLGACARNDGAPGAQSTDAARPQATAPAVSTPPATEAPAPATPPAPAQPPAGESGLAHFDGYGDMRFGMSVEEAKKAWGGELDGDVAADECAYLQPKGSKPPSYFGFMFEGGKFVRYDVRNDRETAPGGGKLGMTSDEIRALYAGRVEDTPHKYVEGGHYLKVKGAGGALVFEIDAAGKVTGWHAGVEPQVDYIEGCS